MIPYILTAVGGYLIGSSLKKSQDGKYEDGGDIKFDNADEIIKILSKNGYKVSKPESFYNGSSYGKDYQILGFELVDAYTKYLGLPIKKSPYGFIVNKNNKLQNFYYHTNEGFTTTSNLKEFLNNIPKNTNYANGGDIKKPEKIISLYESLYENGKEYMRLLAQGVYTKEREEQFKKRAKEAIDKKFDEGRYDYKQEVYVHNKNVREPYLQKYQVFANGGEIANTILSQLGGARRLNIMTGAYNFVDLGSGVAFKLKNPRANYVKIQLNSMDLYDIEVGRIRGTDYKVVDSANNLYFDQLKPFIEKATGLYLSL